MNNRGAVEPARRFAWPGKNNMQAHKEMRVAFAEDGYLICDHFASAKECAEMIVQADNLIAAFDETAEQIVFSASGQSHAASSYFMNSASQISCFLEAGAVDEAGRLIKPKTQAINKIGHALHDLDPVFSHFSRQDKCADMARLLGLNTPLLLQSMVICKQPFIGGEVNSHQDSTFLYTEPESTIGFWFALEDANKTNGCLQVASGGHKGPLRKLFKKVDGKMKMIDLNNDPFPETDTFVEVKKGSLVLLHGRLPHYSCENTSLKSRHAYTVHVIDKNNEYPEWNWLQRSSLPLKSFIND